MNCKHTLEGSPITSFLYVRLETYLYTRVDTCLYVRVMTISTVFVNVYAFYAWWICFPQSGALMCPFDSFASGLVINTHLYSSQSLSYTLLDYRARVDYADY